LIAALCGSSFGPLRRKVSDEQVALYLEEHEPALQATLLSAVSRAATGRPPNPKPSFAKSRAGDRGVPSDGCGAAR
jgi:hypothetical protein